MTDAITLAHPEVQAAIAAWDKAQTYMYGADKARPRMSFAQYLEHFAQFVKGHITIGKIAELAHSSTARVSQIYKKYFQRIFGLTLSAIRRRLRRKQRRQITKTAEKTLFEHEADMADAIQQLRNDGCTVALIPSKNRVGCVLHRRLLVNGQVCSLHFVTTTQSRIVLSEAVEYYIFFQTVPSKSQRRFIVPTEELRLKYRSRYVLINFPRSMQRHRQRTYDVDMWGYYWVSAADIPI